MGQCLAVHRRIMASQEFPNIPQPESQCHDAFIRYSPGRYERRAARSQVDYYLLPQAPRLMTEDLDKKEFQRLYDARCELVECPAGRRAMQLDVQIYADRYEATLNKILETSQELDKGLEDIFQAYTKDDPLADKVMNCRLTVDEMGRVYEHFFRESAWNLDSFVEYRKNLARDAYLLLADLKIAIQRLGMHFNPNFEDAQVKVDFQIMQAEQIIFHFKRTYRDALKHNPDSITEFVEDELEDPGTPL